MAEIDVRPALLRIIGNDCGDVAPMVGRGRTAFDEANTLGRLNLGELESAAALTACQEAWRDAFREGTRVVSAVSDSIHGTAAAVEAADQNAPASTAVPNPICLSSSSTSGRADMAVDYATLRDMGDLSAQSFSYGFGFDLAELHASTARDSFEDVVDRIAAGRAWTGEGRPSADAVLRQNAVALKAAETQMAAGTRAMQALGVALTTARDDAEKALEPVYDAAEGTNFEVLVLADGSVGPVKVNSYAGDEFDDQERIDIDIAAAEAELKLKVAIGYANAADTTARIALASIANAVPVFSADASAKTLAYNEVVLDIAQNALSFSTKIYEFWAGNRPSDLQDVIPKHWSTTDTIKNVLGIEDLKNFIDTYSLKAAEKVLEHHGGKPIPIVGPLLTVIQGYEAGDNEAELGDAGDGLDGNLAKPDVHDSELQDKLDEYFLGNGSLTLAQAAKLQAIGQLADDHDYVADAENAFVWLNGWLAQHPPVYPEASGEPLTQDQLELQEDREQALALAHELDDAIH